MKKIIALVVVILLVAASWFFYINFFSQGNDSVFQIKSDQSSNTVVLVDLKKYYNQPINLVKTDWPTATTSLEKKRVIFKGADFTLVSASREENGIAYYVQAETENDTSCTKGNFNKQSDKMLASFGFTELVGLKPNKQSDIALNSNTYCDTKGGYAINVSCLSGTRYHVNISALDPTLCGQ